MFIVFEGIDGSGKTTQVKLLAERLSKEGREVVVTREPGGTRIGGQIRELLLNPANREITYRAEAMLYAADRAQHVGEKILPALKAGRIVICDRFTGSTLAYQGGGRGIDREFLNRLNQLAVSGVHPDMVFLLDVPPRVGLERLADNGTSMDRLESEGILFYNRVRETYLALAANSGSLYRVLDGRMPPEDVHRAVWSQLGG
jgi:dTMP kinase